MKRPDPATAEAPGGPAQFPDDRWVKSMPLLCEYLASDAWDDGKPREQSTVSIKCQDGRVLAVLNDLEMRRSLYVSAETVEGALKALEKHLGSSLADWRAWKGPARKK
jgi:hypothetical protein